MNKTQKAVDEVRTFGRGFRALLTLTDRMEEIGNLEQAENELKASRERLLKEQGEILATSAKAKADGEAAAEKLASDSKTEAARVIDEAKAKAEKTKTDAEANAARVIEKAEAKREQLERENAAAEGALSDLRARHDALAKECTDLEARLEKAKAQAAKMLGV